MHVNFTLKAPWSHLDVVTTICGRAEPPITIKYLSPELGTTVGPRGKTVSGYVWDEINRVTHNFDGMYWWVSNGALTVAEIIWTPPQDFDEVAGRIVSDARRKLQERKYLSLKEHLDIAAQLDALENFKPLEVLPNRCRKKLAEWNMKNASRAILTFVKATKALEPSFLHSQILKRLYRAEETFKQRQGLPGHSAF
jgi:hypothetical protein